MPLLLATLGDELAEGGGSFTASWFLLASGKRRNPRKSHPGRQVRTRAYHPGEHVVDIQADGLAKATERFDLRT
ncbi:hypothetical protein G3I34_02240 [Streptomyces sp. SID8014]|uniref:hypothetical protein n=1 Tax=Streptomyces sp. SID8014 TaxID=2706097 RepID=UPI0013BCD12D|nr:hypothetical protein [Streptomyces sp. SID8014]NEC11149.1 hypothetical protein [Streptomyces sp. SID8014]